jgi:xanthine dehydrogenase accessory factor
MLPDRAAAEDAVDPVCGMSVARVPATPTAVVDGTTHWFCGAGCRQGFLDGTHGTAGTAP